MLTLFTGGLYLSTRSLWISTERLVQGADQTAKKQLRAYLHVSVVGFDDLLNIAKFNVSYKNYGATPAFDITHWCVLTYAPFSNEEILDERRSDGRGPLGLLGPSQEDHFVKPGPRQLTIDEIKTLHDGTGIIYLFGQFFYRDAFGDHWQTSFRYTVGGGMGISDKGRMNIGLEGNVAT